MALVVGILWVSALNARNITITPKWVGLSFNQSFNITVTNIAGSAVINVVRITKPSDFVDIFCVNPVPVATAWSCSTNGTKAGSTFVEFTAGTIAAGASQSFNITSTAPNSAGDFTFQVRTEDDASGFNTTSLLNNVSVDALPPLFSLMNVSDGTRILSSGGHFDGTRYFSNSTGKINIVFNATDNESGIGILTVYYNATNSSDTVIVRANHTISGAFDRAFVMSNGSFGPGTLWNATFDGDNLLNGTRIIFTVVVNDTARNGNVSNYTSPNSDRVYNFTVDSAAPRFEDVQILNNSLPALGGGGNSINTTKTFGSTVEYILNSSMLL
ncbi:MAG: hypothetical protein AABX60_02345, partial [Nanoarchaeota archaeon]